MDGDSGFGFHLADAVIDRIEIGHRKLKVDDIDIVGWVDWFFVITKDGCVIETTDDFDDGIALTDGRKELVAKAFSFGGAFDETGDVIEIESGVDLLLWVEGFGEIIEPLIWDQNDTSIWVDGREWVILRQNVRIRYRVEEC